MLGVPAHGPGQCAGLDVATHCGKLLRRVGVVDAGHFLLDDRAGVEVGRHVVRGGADQLHPARVRLVVGPRAAEARQE